MTSRAIVIVVAGLCIVAVAAWILYGPRDRLGLEHTIYLYHKLIDPPVVWLGVSR